MAASFDRSPESEHLQSTRPLGLEAPPAAVDTETPPSVKDPVAQARAAPFVQVPPRLLHSLRSYQAELRIFVEGYIELRDWSLRCQKLVAVLRQRGRVEDDAFWDQLEAELSEGTKLSFLPQALCEANKEAVEKFDTAFQEAMEGVDNAYEEDGSQQRKELSTDVLAHVRLMDSTAADLAAACKRDARKLMEQVNSCVDQIFVAVDHHLAEGGRAEPPTSEEKIGLSAQQPGTTDLRSTQPAAATEAPEQILGERPRERGEDTS